MWLGPKSPKFQTLINYYWHISKNWYFSTAIYINFMYNNYYRIAGKFGGLYYYNHQIKICQNFLLTYIRMVIPYWTTKFNPPIFFLGSTAKFNSRQYFRLYSIMKRIYQNVNNCTMHCVHHECKDTREEESRNGVGKGQDEVGEERGGEGNQESWTSSKQISKASKEGTTQQHRHSKHRLHVTKDNRVNAKALR